jgi:hypothetical protein
LAALGALAQEVPPPALAQTHIRSLGSVARLLARSGRRAEALELCGILEDGGTPPKQLDGLRLTCERNLEKAKRVAPAVPEAARQLRRAAGKITAGLEGERAAALARLALHLDSEAEGAHRLLGHVRHAGHWVAPAMRTMLEQRARIADATRRARHLPLEIEAAPSELDLMERVHGRRGRRLSCGGLHLHSGSVSEDKMRRILATALRATALSHYIVAGVLKVPTHTAPLRVVLTTKAAHYAAWRTHASRAGVITEQEAQRVATHGWFWLKHGTLLVVAPRTEARTEALLVLYELKWQSRHRYHGAVPQPTLLGGHVNWLCQTFLGVSLPHVNIKEVSLGVRKEGRTAADIRETRERKVRHRLAKAGLVGLRSWMAYLAARGEDPPWWKSFQDQTGKIAGNELLKTTAVVEYLQERGEYARVMRATFKVAGDRSARKQAFENALGRPLDELEREWREWILHPPRGLAQRLAAPRAEAPAWLRYLDDVRRRPLGSAMAEEYVPVALDPDLSAGARAHALYLQDNPAQQQKWPDAHEEYPDRPGYTVAGAWAGLHSVIAFQQKSAPAAIDGWLATFYHRLPLLDPGLLRVGWGLKNGIAVLDTSLSDPLAWACFVVWPAPGAENVPHRFAPELPNPVPSADQSRWGYPVTLQCFASPVEHAPGLRLYEGRRSPGVEVECHYATPERPTNRELAPRGAYCLIPKAALKPKTTYWVRGTDPLAGKPYAWSFRTAP